MQKQVILNPESLRSLILTYFNKNKEAKFIHRLHAILLKIENQSRSSEDIAALFGQTGKSISTWINKINSTGDIHVLRDKAKVGRSPRLTMHHEEDIKRALQLPPEESGIVANLWDGKTLSHYIGSRYHIVLGVRQCQRLFKKLGFSLKRARPAVAKADAVKKEASKKTSGKNRNL